MTKSSKLINFAVPLLFIASYAKADTPPKEVTLDDLSKIAPETTPTAEKIPTNEKSAIDLTALSVEDLMKVDITSANKKVQSSTEVPSAIYVLSSEDIHRSGATTIPEALRMVPGIFIERFDSNKWSVSIRGNTGRFNNKLLVMIDGRTVYDPTYSGVYWEVQDVTLQDIQQIEVIRGPGGTIWGANAVTGIINIITKKSVQTQGLLASLTAGNYDESIADLRYGDSVNDNLSYRVYGKYTNRGSFKTVFGENAYDDWNMKRGGMRADWKNEKNELTLSGDLYNGNVHQLGPLPISTPPYSNLFSETVDPSGWNVSSRWDTHINDKTNFALQLYYDVAKRGEIIALQKQKTLDVDSNLNYILNERHELNFGLGLRVIRDINIDTNWSVFPGPTTKSTYSGFIQDAISIIPKTLILTLGSKIEHNDYTDFEFQPSARLTWIKPDGSVAWASYSQAVRTPARLDTDGKILLNTSNPFGGFGPNVDLTLSGQDTFVSEKLTSYELGYRFLLAKKANIDFATFYNEYDKLRSNETGANIIGNPIIVPMTFDNAMYGHSWGYEIGAQCNPIVNWELKLAYSEFHQNLELRTGSNFINGVYFAENDTPRRIVSLFSKYQFAEKWDLDLWLKAASEFAHSGADPATGPIPGYLLADLRLAYKPINQVEIAIVGQNLNKRKHHEGNEEYPRIPSDVPRAFYVNITYKS